MIKITPNFSSLTSKHNFHNDLWFCYSNSQNEYWYFHNSNSSWITISGNRIGTELISVLNNDEHIENVLNDFIKQIETINIIDESILLNFAELSDVSIFCELLIKSSLYKILSNKNSTDKKKDIIKTLKEVCMNITIYKNYFEIIQGLAGFNTDYKHNFKGLNIERLSKEKQRQLYKLFTFMYHIELPSLLITYGIENKNGITLFDEEEFQIDPSMYNDLKDNDISVTQMLFSAIKKGEMKSINKFKISNFKDFLNVSLYMLMTNNQTINKCQNCRKYFFVKSKSNEKYCSNIFKNNKTCSQLSYEIKLSKDNIAKLYRNTCKKSGIYRTRNLANKPYVEKLHQEFLTKLKVQKKLCNNGKINLNDFSKWIDENCWWKK